MRPNIAVLLQVLHQAECQLAADLEQFGQRHRRQHRAYNLTRHLAGWSATHAELIAATAQRLGGDPDGVAVDPAPLSAPAEAPPAALRQSPDPGLLLLRDLRRIHRDAVALSVDWELLAESAERLGHEDLRRLVERCLPQTLRQVRWARSVLNLVSPRILTG